MRNALYIFCLSLSGCMTVAPDLKLPEQQCNRLAMPAVPQDAELTIHGAEIHADKGGEELLRFYVRARQLLR